MSASGPSIAIIGGGIGAITLGLELDARGLTNWTAYEKMDGIGGTWYTNRYPGCRCDVPAIVYSHSRFQNTHWTQSHPERAEINEYWTQLARNQGLLGRIVLSTEFVRSKWDSIRKLHVLTLRGPDGKEFSTEAQIIINAAGGLNTPKYVELPGKESFEGQVIHAADWPRDLTTESLHGKTVVVVGNGCSGVQLVGTLGLDPEINVISLARGAQWFIPSNPGEPRHSVPYTERRIALMNRFPRLQALERWITCAVMDSMWYWYVDKAGAKKRAQMQKDLTAWMLKELPEYMHATAIPKHSFGAKRLIFEDGYFAALKTDHVKAVDGRVASLKEKTVVLDDGRELSADLVVLATGYDAEAVNFDVAGPGDRTRNYRSKADWVMYRGVALPGIPNYFTLLGNNVGLNHMSITTVLELQAAQLGKLIQGMRDYNVLVLDVKADAAKEYDAWIEKRLRTTTWYQVKNYWRGDNGMGRIFTHYPGSVRRMYWENHSIKWRDYLGAEPIVRAQRRRRVITLALVLAASYLGLRTNALAVLREAAQTATTTVLRHVQSLVASIRAKDPTCRAS